MSNMTAEITGGYGTVTIDSLRRHNGVAGSISVEIDATYVWSDSDTPERSTATPCVVCGLDDTPVSLRA